MRRYMVFSIMALVLFQSCSMFGATVYYEIEVGESEYAIVKLESTNSLKVKYRQNTIDLGVFEQGCEPISIMVDDGEVYVVKLFTKLSEGISARNDWGFRFFQQKGNGIVEISASQFPKRIAITNFELLMRPKSTDPDGNIITDDLKIGRERDIKDVRFRRSLTAHLWCHLETGQSYWDIVSENTVEEGLLNEYISKNKPVRLTLNEAKKVSKKEACF